MVSSASRTKLIRMIPTVFKGTHVDLDDVRTARANGAYLVPHKVALRRPEQIDDGDVVHVRLSVGD
jgi:hypothetical protein